jgi:hypothetical protein
MAEIKTLFNIGDDLFFILNDRINRAEIKKIHIVSDEVNEFRVDYIIEDFSCKNNEREINECAAFKTIEDLFLDMKKKFAKTFEQPKLKSHTKRSAF